MCSSIPFVSSESPRFAQRATTTQLKQRLKIRRGKSSRVLHQRSGGSGASSIHERDLCLLVGGVDEDDVAHQARHAGLGQALHSGEACARCLAIRWREEITRFSPWAAPKPRHLGGAWALGCRICSVLRSTNDLQQRRKVHIAANREHSFCKQAISRCGAWASFQVRHGGNLPKLKLRLAAHANTDMHRLAADVANSPRFMLGIGAQPAMSFSEVEQSARVREAACFAGTSLQQPAALKMQALKNTGGMVDVAIGSIQDSFRGNVPRRTDFLDVWADSTTVMSLRTQVTIQEKRGAAHVVERRRKRQILAIEAEIVRQDCRKRLREASSISLAVDECDTRKVIRVRCDTPEAPYQWDGIIGVIRRRYGLTEDVAAEVKEDHAVHSVALLDDTIRTFFTPLPCRQARKRKVDNAAGNAVASSAPASGGKRQRITRREQPQCDEVELGGFRAKVRILCADGGSGERRALFRAAQHYFPNVDQVIRDPAHGVRIAICKPLQLEAYFKEVFDELINKRHALIPDIQNSGKWTQILHGLQQKVLRIPSLDFDGSLQVVLKHLSFAKIRMDSCADPLAKVCLMAMPIALLLALISADERCEAGQRERARNTLKMFQPKFMLGAGVSADWGIITLAFLRLYDRLDHDISNSMDELEDFCSTIEACFVQGGVFCKLPAASGADQGKPAMFITERVRMQIQARCVFHCGQTEQVIWGPMRQFDLGSLASSLRAAATAMIRRVRAEFMDVRTDFCCMALRLISTIVSCAGYRFSNIVILFVRRRSRMKLNEIV